MQKVKEGGRVKGRICTYMCAFIYEIKFKEERNNLRG